MGFEWRSCNNLSHRIISVERAPQIPAEETPEEGGSQDFFWNNRSKSVGVVNSLRTSGCHTPIIAVATVTTVTYHNVEGF